jgi:hypothetical protein
MLPVVAVGMPTQDWLRVIVHRLLEVGFGLDDGLRFGQTHK